MKTWTVLEERDRYVPLEPRILFRRQSKGSPRFYINVAAVQLMKLAKGARVQLLAPPDAGVRPLLGLRTVSDGGVALRASGNTRSLCLVSSAAASLAKSYSRISYRPRVGKEGEPSWVLEPVSSEKGGST